MRESPTDARRCSYGSRFGLDSGRSAPCVQPETHGGRQRGNVGSARDVLPRSVQFSVAKSVQFSVAIDSRLSRPRNRVDLGPCAHGSGTHPDVTGAVAKPLWDPSVGHVLTVYLTSWPPPRVTLVRELADTGRYPSTYATGGHRAASMMRLLDTFSRAFRASTSKSGDIIDEILFPARGRQGLDWSVSDGSSSVVRPASATGGRSGNSTTRLSLPPMAAT